MASLDGQQGWIRKRKIYNAFDLHSLDEDGTSGILQGGLTTSVAQLEVTDSGIMGILMAAGEFLSGMIVPPIDLDPKYEIGFRVHYTGLHDNDGDATVSWILQVDKILEGILIARGATNLDTVIPLLDAYTDDSGASVVTDWLYQVSGRGIWLRGTHAFTRSQIETGSLITIELEMDAVANLTSVVFLGLEMDYVPQRCVGTGADQDRPLVVA